MHDGLTDGDTSSLREIGFNGLYRLTPDGAVTLIDGSHRRPNGVTLSPDGRTLYLALSDEKRPQVLAYSLGADGLPTGQRLFRDMASELAAGEPGLPPGMANYLAESDWLTDYNAALAKATASASWHAAIRQHHWSVLYRNSAELAAYLPREAAEMRATLGDLGLLNVR